jgi:hypothetical protein
MGMSMSITPTGVDPNVLLEFFLTFARFEFALKHAGFFQRPRIIDPADPPDARPDWDCFAASIRLALAQDKTSEFVEAYQYLLDHPPAREVLLNGSLMWEEKAPSVHLPIADRVLQCVRRVRNNLFHGGKFNSVQDADPGRNDRLLRCSMAVLRACLRGSASVDTAFQAAAL